MYAHAVSYPSLHTRHARRLRVRKRALSLAYDRSRRGAHAGRPSPRPPMRALAQRRAARVSWGRELLRVAAVLANVAGWAALVYFVV